MKRRWSLVTAGVVLLLTVSYWVSWIHRPLRMHFTGFISESGTLIATFNLENRSERTLYFGNEVTLHGDHKAHVYSRKGWWTSCDPASGVPNVKSGETCSLKIPLKSTAPEDSLPVAPFRVELNVSNIRSPIWNEPPLRWLPMRLKPPHNGTAWSERVTP